MTDPCASSERSRLIQDARTHGSVSLLTYVGVAAGAVLVLLHSGLRPVYAHEQHEIANCARGRSGHVTLISPTEGQLFSSGSVLVRLEGRCLGGIPMNVGVDGVGYRLTKSGLLVREPVYNPGCRDCWPQMGLVSSAQGRVGKTSTVGQFSHRLLLSPGRHLVVIRPGIEGTDLPSWRPFRVHVTVAGSRLSRTGIGSTWLAVASALIIVGASLLVAARRVDRRNSRAL